MSADPRRLHLLYHELRSTPSQYSYVLESAEFERHARLCLEAKTQGSTRLIPEITFDDGHISNRELALPILASFGLTATFFITAGWTGRRPGYMDWNDLSALLNAGQRIGAHGWSHALLTHCKADTLKTELLTTRLTLEDKLGTGIATMSLPGGRFDERVLEACYAAGYSQVFTSIPRAEPMPTPALVGRLNIRREASASWLAELLDPGTGVLARIERKDRWKSALKRAVGDRVYTRLWSVLNREEAPVDPVEVGSR